MRIEYKVSKLVLSQTWNKILNYMKNNIVVAGNSGPKIRSDCEISLEITNSGGVKLDLQSRVRSMYGKSINDLVSSILSFYNISNSIIILYTAFSVALALRKKFGFRSQTLKSIMPSEKKK